MPPQAKVLFVIWIQLWFARELTAAVSSCVPSCSTDELCKQVHNSNGQYECVATVSPAAAAISPPSSSPIPAIAGCQGCSAGQQCEQVYNSNQYHCVNASPVAASPPAAATSPSTASAPSGCQSCSASQRCQQVYNSNQYHCVESSPAATAASPTPLQSANSTLSPTSSRSSNSISSGCIPACALNEVCEQVYNSKQYTCQAAKGAISPTASLSPVTTVQGPANSSNAPVSVSPTQTGSSPDPAVSTRAASPVATTSTAGLSGELDL